MMSSSNFIERKAIKPSGRLASLYDVISDTLLGDNYINHIEDSQFYRNSTCQIFRGRQVKDVIHRLKAINFDDMLLQSILLDIVEPLGISSIINKNKPINENTLFLYYLYTYRTEKLNVTAGKANTTISHPSDIISRSNRTVVLSNICTT
ncbi:unnamed protein product [Rotaria sp. Silwood2]|nr:unnamed protein product [Rotaria sp. Silwood2]CAF4547881.1 unnamed protein product [Rotaria sp. Silwood2]